tara:strand:+ start:3378 stop:4256 length:879 start_codon:yes stop_codon:yes gene_type:complete
MATVFYDKAAVKVTVANVSEVLLASDCSVSFSNSQQPFYAIGNKGALGQYPNAARQGDVSFSFLTSITGSNFGQPGNIINYIASGIKNSTNSVGTGVTIEFAGVSGVGFLNSYGFDVSSNTISTSNASFSFFGSGEQLPVSGRLSGSLYSPATTATQLATGIAHGRYTTLPSALQTEISSPTAATEVGTIFGADYSISFNHSPVFKVGQEFPTTTFYTTASENINVTEDVFNSGLAFDETNIANINIDLKGLEANSTNKMQVGIKNAKQVSTSMSVGLDDIVRTQKSLTAAY